MALVEVSYHEKVGTLTLNDPAKRNALSSALLDELMAGLRRMQEDHARVVVVRAAAGSKTWSSGHDVRELPVHGRDPLTYTDPLRRAIREIQAFPGAVLALVEGGVWGGACEMAVSCDLVVAAETSTFALTPARIGVPYNLAGTLNLLQSISLTNIKELLFRARPISATRAREIGLVNQVVPVEELDRTVAAIASDIIQNSPLVVALLKEELEALASARPMGAGTYERIQAIRRRIYDSADYQEGIRAFLEKRAPVFTGR